MIYNFLTDIKVPLLQNILYLYLRYLHRLSVLLGMAGWWPLTHFYIQSITNHGLNKQQIL